MTNFNDAQQHAISLLETAFAVCSMQNLRFVVWEGELFPFVAAPGLTNQQLGLVAENGQNDGTAVFDHETICTLDKGAAMLRNDPFSPPPMILFHLDYTLTQDVIATLKAMYGDNTIVRTSVLVPEGKIMTVNLPDPDDRLDEQLLQLDRLLRGQSKT